MELGLCQRSTVDGRRFRALTVVDIYTRESLAIEVGSALKGEDVVRMLNQLKQKRGVPKFLFCDNGSDFTGQALDLWAHHNQVQIDFSARQTDRQCLHRVLQWNVPERMPAHASVRFFVRGQQLIELWRRDYNESRPHRAWPRGH